MKEKLIYTEEVKAINFWYYLFACFPLLIHWNFLFVIIPILILLAVLSYSSLKLINTQIYETYISFSTIYLSHRGAIYFKEINNYAIIEFDLFFDFMNIKKYNYCNGNKISNIKYGIKIMMKDKTEVIIPTKNPGKIISILNSIINKTSS